MTTRLTQTITDVGGPVPGDCWRTAIACLLDFRDPISVPHFIHEHAEGHDTAWWDASVAFVAERVPAGRSLVLIKPRFPVYDDPENGYPHVIATGPSPRGGGCTRSSSTPVPGNSSGTRTRPAPGSQAQPRTSPRSASSTQAASALAARRRLVAELVDPQAIEVIVGVKRHATEHYGRAVSSEQQVYVLHSQACVDSTPDLRDCPFSVALDRGIESPAAWNSWRRLLDRPVVLHIRYDGLLVPDLVAHLADLGARGATSTGEEVTPDG